MLNAQIKALKAEINSLTAEMDARLKAQEHVIDDIIDTFKDELDVLEKRKETLNEQLETLEKQRDTIQETVDNYKTVASYVQDVIQEEIKAIEKERQAIEDAYDERIEKLRAENEEREDALEYEQKLANLNDAKNNKVLSYSSARGWTYETDKEKLKQAENELASFENEQQIKSLEKERDEALKGFDERIEAREKYADEWQETVDSIVEAEQEELAQQILGSEWREKIAKMDTNTLKKFKTEFNNYNTQLKGSINTEIQNLKDSISAIDDDIDAKNKQVTAWNDYKTQLQKAVNDIKGSLEDYNKYLGTVNLSESSTASDREANLQTFITNYSNLATTLSSKQKQVETITATINNLAAAGERLSKVDFATALGVATGGKDNVGSLAVNAGIGSGSNPVGSLALGLGTATATASLERLFVKFKELFQAFGKYFGIKGFSGGGAADYTGLAMIHGSKTHSETVFTSAQSKKLLNLVDALPNFTNFKLNAPKVATKSTTTNIGGSSINIGQMTVVADNPQQFEQQMNRYIQTKLTQSKVY
jgi:chromosome segregation ATPase